MSPKTRESALKALDGMAEIVRNEMTIRGQYVTGVVNPELRAKGAICGGHQACAIGSLWLASGVKATEWDTLPGVEVDDRGEFVQRRPALKLALDALNASAESYIERHNIPRRHLEPLSNDAIETLFEGTNDDGEPTVGRRELLRIIAAAKVRVRNAA